MKSTLKALAIACAVLCVIYHIVYVQNCNSRKCLESDIQIACPAYDIVEWVFTPVGPWLYETRKGLYDETNHSLEQFKAMNGWITTEEYKALQQEELDDQQTEQMEEI